MHLDYSRQCMLLDRYTAEPVQGFGLCVYTVGNKSQLYCQTFPTNSADLQVDYIAHITRLARAGEKAIRNLYPFFRAPDVLTMKCLIEEACNNWMDLCSRKQS